MEELKHEVETSSFINRLSAQPNTQLNTPPKSEEEWLLKESHRLHPSYQHCISLKSSQRNFVLFTPTPEERNILAHELNTLCLSES